MNILIIDAYTAQHIGNLALVDGALEQMKAKFPKAEFTILAFDPASIEKHSGCKTFETLWAEPFSGYSALKKIGYIVRESTWMLANIFNFSVLKPMGLLINPRKYTLSKKKLIALKAYSDADIVVSISGEAMQDSFWKRIPLFLFGYWLAHSMGKVVVLFPQSIGPFRKGFIRSMVGYVLNLCDLILPRDDLSLKTVRQLKIDPKKVYLVPDVAVTQPHVSLSEAKKLLEAEGVNLDRRPLVGMAISKFENIDYKGYFLVMREVCRFIVEDLKGAVVFFIANRTFRQETGDWELTRCLHESLNGCNNTIVLSKTYTPRECKGMLGQMNLFISTRMHVSILATMMGTPTITVNTQPKLRGYMELIHQEDRSCDIRDFTIEKARDLVRNTLMHSEQIRLSLEDTKNEIGKRAAMASELLKVTYDQKTLEELSS